MYPRPDSTAQIITYTVGESDTQENSGMSWKMASAYCISLPLGKRFSTFVYSC